MPKIFLYLFFLLTGLVCQAQDTLILITGRTFIVKSVEIGEYSIGYQKIDPKNPNAKTRMRSMDPERVFAVHFKNGTEQVVFQTDTFDSADFTVEEMRKFIKGEQDAREFYHNQSPKILGLAVGAGSSIFTFYGLIGPPLFSTVLGSFSPNVDKKLTFDVKGSAAAVAGFEETEIFNNAAGKTKNPVFTAGSELKINRTTIDFPETTTLDSAVAKINATFDNHYVHASNESGRLNLYRSSRPDFLQDPIYREGFEKRVRDFKIRNAMLSGLVGFIATTITLSVIYHK